MASQLNTYLWKREIIFLWNFTNYPTSRICNSSVCLSVFFSKAEKAFVCCFLLAGSFKLCKCGHQILRNHWSWKHKSKKHNWCLKNQNILALYLWSFLCKGIKNELKQARRDQSWPKGTPVRRWGPEVSCSFLYFPKLFSFATNTYFSDSPDHLNILKRPEPHLPFEYLS